MEIKLHLFVNENLLLRNFMSKEANEERVILYVKL